MMLLTRNWWLVALRGLLAILFGLTAFFWLDLTWLVLMFGVYAMVDGAFAMMSGLVSSKYSPRWWVFLLEGLVGAYALIFGILLVALGLRLRKLDIRPGSRDREPMEMAR